MEKSKKIRSIVAGCLAAVTLATAGLAVATDGFKSFKKNDNIQMELPEENNGGTVIGESTGNGVKVMSAKIAKEDYVANGISPLAETAYTLTATITPSNATIQDVDWSVSFVNNSSAWATGKTVTDYVPVTPSGDLVGLSDEEAEYIRKRIEFLYTRQYPQGYYILTQCEY